MSHLFPEMFLNLLLAQAQKKNCTNSGRGNESVKDHRNTVFM